jgi:predicted nucleic acid-binding protein
MKVFLDANIFIDVYDEKRKNNKFSSLTYEYLLKNEYSIFTSCDLITTIYYINSKIDKKQALLNMQDISKTLKIIEFSNKEVEECCKLMLEDNDYTDLEDTIQYVMAKKYNCELIISNDKNFVAKDIKILSSEEFCKEYIR